MPHFKRCDGCGGHSPHSHESCLSCGRSLESLRQLATPGRIAGTTGPGALALLIWLALPSGTLPPAGEAMLEGSLLGVGLAPLLIALAWLTMRKRRRDPGSFSARAEEAEIRRDEIEADLARTEARIRSAKNEMERERSPRLLASLRAELHQDRRLRKSQRRLVRQLEQRLQQLGIEQFRGELLYFEAHREDTEANPLVAAELAAKIEQARDELSDGGPAWEQALEDARALHHQLARGIERLAAARRLDPLRYADLTALEPEGESFTVPDESDLGGQIDHHLERIDSGFEALDELRRELSADADASGLRMRVDDDVLAALDAEEEELAFDEGARISVTGI